MIVFRFDDDRKFPLVCSLTNVGQDVRLEIVRDAIQRSLRIVTTGEDTVDDGCNIVLALPLNAVDGAPGRIELEVTGNTRPLRLYIEGSNDAGVGLVWELSGLERTGRHVLSALVDKPREYWDRGDDIDTPVAPPLAFQRLRLTAPCTQSIDVVLHELRVTGNVRLVPAELSDS